MQLQLNIPESQKARDEGIDRAVNHAEEVNPGWNERADQLLIEFLGWHRGEFLAEDVRSYAAMIDFPLPPHARAFAGVIVRAVKKGLIERTGYAPVKNVKAHRATVSVWRRAA